MKITKFFALLCAATVGFVACVPTDEETPQPAPEVTGNITLTADKTQIELGDRVNFTATMKDAETGEVTDVTAFVDLYDSELEEVSNPFIPTVSGIYNVMASMGAESSNVVTITVMATLPEIPEDIDPANLAFNHRAILVDHTGVNCGYCPMMTDTLIELAKTDLHEHYNEVTCHAGSMASGDPANSAAANALNQMQKPDGYPNICINFNTAKIGNYQTNTTISYIRQALNGYIKKDGADVGIALAVEGDSSCTYCSAQVKVNVEQEYKAVAWLLESGIYSPNQAGASKAEHKIYNYALRNISGEYSKNNVSGESIGVLAQGEKKDLAFTLPITSTKWNWENMGVLVIVSAKNANGSWEVANSAYCPLGEAKGYEYIN